MNLKIVKIGALSLVVILFSFFTYLGCYYIAETYFFDKFFYKKSIEYGYDISKIKSTSFTDRNKDFSILTDSQVLGISSDIFQIVVIGNSYVFGSGIRNENRFSKLLENKLNKIRTTKIISLSQTSTSPLDYFDWYQQLQTKISPNLYVFALVDNDAYIRPNYDLTLSDTNNIVKNCQQEYPLITPVLDTNLVFWYKGINSDTADINNIVSKEYLESWSNPINLCVLDNSLSLLPIQNSIYFITDDYNNNSEMFGIYQKYLNLNHKYIISSYLGKNIPAYTKYWNTDPYKNFQVSNMEQHPNVLANQMYADILFNEITTNPKWNFIKK